MLHDLQSRMNSLTAALEAPTDTLEQLQGVLATVIEIRTISMEMELAFNDVVERFRALRVYGLEVNPDDAKAVEGIRQRWQDLLFASRSRDRALLRVKERFTQVTQSDVSSFAEQTGQMRARIAKHVRASWSPLIITSSQICCTGSRISRDLAGRWP